MELLKQSRTQHRRLFTQACNEYEKVEANLNIADKLMKLKIISEKGKSLLLAEEKVRDELSTLCKRKRLSIKKWMNRRPILTGTEYMILS